MLSVGAFFLSVFLGLPRLGCEGKEKAAFLFVLSSSSSTAVAVVCRSGILGVRVVPGERDASSGLMICPDLEGGDARRVGIDFRIPS